MGQAHLQTLKISEFARLASSGQERGAVDTAEAEVTFKLGEHEF